jgi:ferredoxin
MPTNIYVLKLEQNKYYVGKTKNVAQRYQEHLQGLGSSWTRKYKPVKLDTVIENASPFDEDKQVKIYMAQFGIENVRGGTYVAETLTDEQLQTLKAEIRSSNDLCNKCGRPSHFFKDCYAKSDTDGNVIDTNTNDQMSKLDLISTIIGAAVSAAVKEALISLDLVPKKLIKKVVKKPSKPTVPEQKIDSDACHRCGRTGHFAKGCYAKTHINGYDI